MRKPPTFIPYKLYGKVLFYEMRTVRDVKPMTEAGAVKKRGHLGVLLITIAAVLTMSPVYVADYLQRHGHFSISILALASLAMFLVGAYLTVQLLKE